MKRRLVVLHGQQVVGLGVEDGLGDVRIASHGVDGDQGAFEVEALHQRRDGGDLVGFFVDRLLAQHQPAVGGEGRDQMQGLLPALAVVAAPRGLAVDRHQVGLVRPAFGHPRRKTGRKQLRIDPIHDRAQPVGARDAVVKLREPRRKDRCASPQSTMSS